MSIYLITLIVITVSAINGALIDARMWNDKEKDVWWLKKYTDYIWLCGWGLQFILGTLVGYYAFAYGIESILYFIGFIIYSFLLCGVFWDLVFCKLESNVWIRPIRLWAKFGIPFITLPDKKINNILSFEENSVVIGFNTNEDLIKFNAFRITLYLLTITYILFA